MKEKELKKRWEDWYGDLVSGYQWCELDYKGNKVIYVSGRFVLSDDGSKLGATFNQVIGYSDTCQPLNEEEQKEIRELFRRQHGSENVSFWTFDV